MRPVQQDYALRLQALSSDHADLAQAVTFAVAEDLDPVVVLLLGLHRQARTDLDRLSRARAETRKIRQQEVRG